VLAEAARGAGAEPPAQPVAAEPILFDGQADERVAA
jgi:hypothetical protein